MLGWPDVWGHIVENGGEDISKVNQEEGFELQHTTELPEKAQFVEHVIEVFVEINDADK